MDIKEFRSKIDIGQITNFYRKNKYQFDPHQMNFINVRSMNAKAGKFDDFLVTILPVGSNLRIKVYACTVDPSAHYLAKPMRKEGTAIVLPGQYFSAWKLGKHKGKYDALVQNDDIVVVRDNDKDNVLDIPQATIVSKIKDINYDDATRFDIYVNAQKFQCYKGMFGINMHRASKWKILQKVGLYGAGCTVVQSAAKYDIIIADIKADENNYNRVYSPIWTDTNMFFYS